LEKSDTGPKREKRRWEGVGIHHSRERPGMASSGGSAKQGSEACIRLEGRKILRRVNCGNEKRDNFPTSNGGIKVFVSFGAHPFLQDMGLRKMKRRKGLH